MNYAKESVNNGKLVLVDTEGRCNAKVLITPSLNAFAVKSKMPVEATLLEALQRTLSAVRFSGQTPPRVLRVYVSAKDNVYFESLTMPWDESESPALIFALPGQINEEAGYITEITTEARERFNSMTGKEKEEMRQEAIALAKGVLADPRAPQKAKDAAIDLLSMEAARVRREAEEGGKGQ